MFILLFRCCNFFFLAYGEWIHPYHLKMPHLIFAFFQNLREAIATYRNSILRQPDEMKREASLSFFVEYLERYYFLICFAVYLHSEMAAHRSSSGGHSSFADWMRARPELYSIIRRLLFLPIMEWSVKFANFFSWGVWIHIESNWLWLVNCFQPSIPSTKKLNRIIATKIALTWRYHNLLVLGPGCPCALVLALNKALMSIFLLIIQV